MFSVTTELDEQIEKRRAYKRQYYKENKDRCNASFNKWRSGKGKATFNASVARCQKNKRHRLRSMILEHYGGTPPKCACCGETIIEFLTIDHINNDGSKQKLEIIGHKHSGDSLKLYNWIIQNNYPDDLQILCMNCNWAKRVTGICPHQTRKDTK